MYRISSYIVVNVMCYVLVCTICTVWYKINQHIGLLVICCAFLKLSTRSLITLTC